MSCSTSNFLAVVMVMTFLPIVAINVWEFLEGRKKPKLGVNETAEFARWLAEFTRIERAENVGLATDLPKLIVLFRRGLMPGEALDMVQRR